MINERVNQAMNEQIACELESYYIYLSMACYFESISLTGMARWMRAQCHEETTHAMRFVDHINDRGGKVVLRDLKQLKTAWSSTLEAWEDALKHERFISSKVNDLLGIVREEKDYPAEPVLSWFIDEQIEEESNAASIVDQIKLTHESQHAILMLDRELGVRPFPAGSCFNKAAYNAAG